MFEFISRFYRTQNRNMEFVWHGGEPLLLSPDFYLAVFEMQARILGSASIRYNNSIQTNLVTLPASFIPILREKFSNVGVSIDLFGEDRVNLVGTNVQDRVVKNLQKLRDENVNFGCITVLSRGNFNFTEQIYSFFEEINASFRLLPIYRTGYKHQNDSKSLNSVEIVECFMKVVDHWCGSESNIKVKPIQDYVLFALRKLSDEVLTPQYYQKRECEVVKIVDTDGQVYSNGDAYDGRLSHGNIFEESLLTMAEGPGFSQASKDSDERLKQACEQCSYFGSCSGFFMAEATPEQRELSELGTLTCSVVKPTIDYILRKLDCIGIADRVNERLRELKKEELYLTL